MSGGRVEPPPLIAVTGSTKPYIYDLPHMLSLPAGFEFRFRYFQSLVEPGLLKKITTDPTAFRERSLILIFHSSERKCVIPVRRASVVNVEVVGAMTYLRFRVGEFISVSAAQGKADAASRASGKTEDVSTTLHEAAEGELEGRQTEYEAQVLSYVACVAAATGERTCGVLSRV